MLGSLEMSNKIALVSLDFATTGSVCSGNKRSWRRWISPRGSWVPWIGMGSDERKRADANGARGTGSAKGGVAAAVKALQYKQRGDAYPDHAAEAEGQPVREVV